MRYIVRSCSGYNEASPRKPFPLFTDAVCIPGLVLGQREQKVILEEVCSSPPPPLQPLAIVHQPTEHETPEAGLRSRRSGRRTRCRLVGGSTQENQIVRVLLSGVFQV
ncbi:hypothetical protein BaRGS_00003382 [Batillaria attramentaria]|uniref:Uncharacterized protein n=1 Tax=Batillaria attramentaria TaxID=370345 RepID=A0ABD0M020_9CAEN